MVNCYTVQHNFTNLHLSPPLKMTPVAHEYVHMV